MDQTDRVPVGKKGSLFGDAFLRKSVHPRPDLRPAVELSYIEGLTDLPKLLLNSSQLCQFVSLVDEENGCQAKAPGASRTSSPRHSKSGIAFFDLPNIGIGKHFLFFKPATALSQY